MMALHQATLEHYLTTRIGRPVQVSQLRQLGGSSQGAAALKAFGYGRPLRIDYSVAGEECHLVLRQVQRNGFGHERQADCIGEIWLDFDTFGQLDRHITALDVVGVTKAGKMISLGDVREMVLLTNYAPGNPYADDLLRIRDAGVCNDLDVQRAVVLARYLADIHAVHHDDPELWRRRLRDLIGDGEGIMGLTDSYPTDFALASRDDLRALEEVANRWRWRLKPLAQRLSQVHGDFHPFNILFTEGETFHLLDRSRGAGGEPADDVSCLAINYLFFALQRYGELVGPFAELYSNFWTTYLQRRADPQLPYVIQPWFAWRALILASPQWYPTLASEVRRKLLRFAHRILVEERFEWQAINYYLET